MHAPATRPVDPAAAARPLLESQSFGAALALLDPARAPGAAARLLRVEALWGLEQFAAAQEGGRALLQDGSLTGPERIQAMILAARMALRGVPQVDEALELALDAASAVARVVPATVELRQLAGLARLEAAHGFARKGCRGLATAQLELAQAPLGDDPRLHVAAARLHLLCDEREPARERFAAALAQGAMGRRLGSLGLALVAALAGDFAAAHARLDALEPLAADDREARRLRLRFLAAQGRWPEAAAVLEHLIATGAHADTRAADRHEHAAMQYRAGHREAARSAWQALGGDPGASPVVVRARRNAALLARPEAATAARRQLLAFPTVAQLRDHCGPAAVELYLRFFGLPAEQVAVARAIKQPVGGTPVWRMRRYLEAAGFTALRLEADLPVLRRCLDAGLPVIMEEDYSASRHVAVAIGYDDALQVLLVQDPLSHEVRETPYETWAMLGALSNHGALVAAPQAEAARLAAAGLTEARHVALVDQAWAARDAGQGATGDELATAALALRRDHELAWLYRFQRARDAVLGGGPGAAAGLTAMRAVVAEVLRLWPDDEWPQQLAGEALLLENRAAEAVTAFAKAAQRDPGDARNWSRLAECHLALGREDLALEALTQALRVDPAHVRANENQAWQYLRIGRPALAAIANAVARELNPRNPHNHWVQSVLRARVDDLPGALAALDQAVALAPTVPQFALERARLLAGAGRVDDALAALQALLAQRPDDAGLRAEAAELCYRHGRHDAALAACQELRALDVRNPAAAAVAGAALCASGQLNEGMAELRKALALRPTYAWALAELGRHLARAGRPADAVPAWAAAFGLSGLPAHQLGLAGALQQLGQTAAAAGRARAAAAGQLPTEELELAAQLVAQGEGLTAAHQLLDGLGRKDPGRVALARTHLRLVLERFWSPPLAREPLQRLAAVAPEDPFVLAALGAQAMDTERDPARGEELLRQAMARDPLSCAPRRLLAQRLCAQQRFAEALSVLQGCPSAFVDAELRVTALLGLGQVAEAEQIAAGFAGPTPAGPTELMARMLRVRVAQHRQDFAAALALAEGISRDVRERDDDGRLDFWEEIKFECLLRLGEHERAQRFGEQQAADAASAACLARTALAAKAPAVAEHFVARALALDPAQALALQVRARLQAPVAAAS